MLNDLNEMTPEEAADVTVLANLCLECAYAMAKDGVPLVKGCQIYTALTVGPYACEVSSRP